MSKFSKHQQNIIRNYYENRENISLQRAQELVTELYLSQGKARERHWKNLIGHLEKLGVAPTTISDAPTTNEMRAPYMTRLRMSRPNWSVPSR